MQYQQELPYSIKFFGLPIGDDEISIYARVIVKRKKAEFTIGVRGHWADWKPTKMRFDNSKDYNNYLNNKIVETERKVFETVITMKSFGCLVTPAKIGQAFKGGVAQAISPILIDYVELYTRRLHLQPERYTKGTIAHYKTLINYLRGFLKEKGMLSLRLNEWTRKHFVQFQHYLLTTPNKDLKRPIKKNTANKYLTKLKVIFNYAIANEDISNDPTKGFQLERVKGDREYLTADELKRIEEHDMGGNKSLIKVKYLFLFSVYTGLRFSDAKDLKKQNVLKESDGDHYLQMTQSKTGFKLYRPMLAKAIAIYERFKVEYPEQEHVLPRISNQKVNVYLKVIADLCNIEKRLTHHIARHTFATTVMLDSGIDLKTTSYFMGHASIKTTEVYAKITKQRAAGVVRSLNKQLG